MKQKQLRVSRPEQRERWTKFQEEDSNRHSAAQLLFMRTIKRRKCVYSDKKEPIEQPPSNRLIFQVFSKHARSNEV